MDLDAASKSTLSAMRKGVPFTISEIEAATGLDRSVQKSALDKLRADGKVTTEGVRRGMRYLKA